MNVNQTMHQANLSKWTALFHEQRQSGLTIKDWCSQNGVSVYAFFYWKRIAKETYIQSILPGAVPAQSGQLPSLSGNTAEASGEHELYNNNLSNPRNPQVNPASAAIIEARYHLPLFVPGTLFLFCGRRANKIKGLVWEGDGFLLFTKRVEDGRFSWPRHSNEARLLSPRQFEWLMDGFSIEPQIRITVFSDIIINVCSLSRQ